MLKKHVDFAKDKRKHVLLITNHGCHTPIIDVTTDTGGQNFYVNNQAKALVKLGYKVTILNRGGFAHPVTGKPQRGVEYYDKAWGSRGKRCRVVYLEDNKKEFIPKEELKEKNLTQEAAFFFEISKQIGLNWKDLYFINSHYWDGGILGNKIARWISTHKTSTDKSPPVPHLWTPHSLGVLKKKNYRQFQTIRAEKLNFHYRMAEEERVIKACDAVVSTSEAITQTLAEYKATPKNHLWMPPGINIEDYVFRTIRECRSAIALLRKQSGLSEKKIKNLLKTKVIFLEISRTAKPKKKDLVLKAFGQIKNRDSAVLILNAEKKSPLFRQLCKIKESMPNRKKVILLDEFITDEEVAQLFALANVYISASVMEGWGMSVQQAAASKCAIISSKHVPFVMETMRDDALVVRKNISRLYAEKIDMMVNEPNFRNYLATKAYRASKDNSWDNLTEVLIREMKKRRLLHA